MEEDFLLKMPMLVACVNLGVTWYAAVVMAMVAGDKEGMCFTLCIVQWRLWLQGCG